ncbi:hypothetical protein N7466_008992 [Penicillium verhagenii]|uniref:uncharacterized protein n=1 Tax=Penicillium verhagenii TaxID=1562060 RepID=UPI0025457F10|nr:uncharacterized protein N7466_008992 [Penicillium verhagenii]KAJ5924805.1 hypothetical protein N7466_008992 [Penicillium verhagenii]
MPDEQKGKAFPDVSAKLSAPTKKSLFERQKAEAEAKRAREKAETAAVYEDFVKSFDDDIPTGPRPSDTRLNSFGARGGGLGGGPGRRHFTSSGPRSSGPGTLGLPPHSLAGKRTHEGLAPVSRNRDTALGFDQANTGPVGPPPGFNNLSDDEDYRKADIKGVDRAPAKPTLQLALLPPGTSPSVVKALIPSPLVVDNVHITRPASQAATERRSSAAIVTLASDTAASDIDNAVSALQNKYLGRGYYLSLSRHLSSAAITSNISTGLGSSNASLLPFGAKNFQPTHGARLSRAPPPGSHRGGFAPPSSYGSNVGRGVPSTQVEVKAPLDVKQLRLVHKTLESLLKYGPEFEALLMSRPEVQRDEKWAWIWDARSPGGVYYRWKLWQIVTQPQSDRRNDKLASIFEGGASWYPPDSRIKFEYATQLNEFISDDDYNSSDEEHSDNEDERRNYGGAPPPEGVSSQQDGLGYMNPMQKAKLTHLLARLPTTHAKLRRGDVARITSFAIEHAGSGADEVVDMIVLNILSPLAYTGANPDRELEKAAAEPENDTKDGANASSTRQKMDLSSAKLVGLYIVSDILSSSATSGIRHAWRYRQIFESSLRSHAVFEHLGRLEKELNWGRLKAEKWKRSVGTLLHLWEGWCVFPQDSHGHFVQMFEQPPLTEEEQQKEKEKAEEEQAKKAFLKGKSSWKAVDDEPVPESVDSIHAGATESRHHVALSIPEDESMSDIDGVPMEDSDLEDPEDHSPKDQEKPQPSEETAKTQASMQSGPEPEDPDAVSRRPRKPRPKAEDMFAEDSE